MLAIPIDANTLTRFDVCFEFHVLTLHMFPRAKKSFGQNFLRDPFHLEKILNACLNLAEKTTPVVEFGPGRGDFTAVLVSAFHKVNAVERDRDLIPILQERFAEELASGRLHLAEADAIQIDTEKLVGPSKALWCGNLPYHLTSSFFAKTMTAIEKLVGGVYLIQKEVAQRAAAERNTKNYSRLSVMLQNHFEVDLIHVVPKGAFDPAPKVDGGVISLRPRRDLASPETLAVLNEITRLAFQQRRKQLGNSLKSIDSLDTHLDAINFKRTHRPEDLSPADFLKLAEGILAKRRDEKDSSGAQEP